MDLPPILPVTPPTQPTPPAKPKRHGCLVTWLAVIILLELLGLVAGGASSSSSSMFAGLITPPPPWYNSALKVFAGIDIVCAVFVFMRKKWAFYGCVGVSVGVLAISIIANRTFDGMSSFILPGVLYGVLQIGGENSGWKQLK